MLTHKTQRTSLPLQNKCILVTFTRMLWKWLKRVVTERAKRQAESNYTGMKFWLHDEEMKNISGLQSIDKLFSTPRLLSTTTSDEDLVEDGHATRIRERQYEKKNIAGLSISKKSLEKNSTIFNFSLTACYFHTDIRTLAKTMLYHAVNTAIHVMTRGQSMLGEEKSAFIWLRSSRQKSISRPSTIIYNSGYESNASSTASYVEEPWPHRPTCE